MSNTNVLLEFLDSQIKSQLLPPRKSTEEVEQSLQPLMEYIDKEIENVAILMEGAGKSLTATWESIPLPTLSELGWADAGKKGNKGKNPQRAEIEGFLNKIAPGNALPKKLKQIQNVINGDLEQAGIDVDKEASMGEIISYLVFLKTLTFIIQSFNQASAGFSFESLMGVLVGGHQIPADTGTIADFVTGGGLYVSLKLLTEGGSTIDGSFVQLVEDLNNEKMKGRMIYLVALKSLTGEGENLEGEVKFYQFSFTRETLAPILMASEPGKRCLEMADKSSRDLLEGGAEEYTRLDFNQWVMSHFAFLEDNATDREEFKKVVDNAYARLEGEDAIFLKPGPDSDEEEVQHVFDSLFDGETFVNFDRKDQQKKGAALTNPIHKYLVGLWNEYNSQDEKKYIKDSDGNKKINPNYIPTETEEYAGRASKIKFMSAEESVAWLDKSAGDDKEYFELLRKYSRGYHQNKQFIVQQSTMISASKNLGSLIVGQKKTLKVLEKMITQVNKKMFESFENMKTLSDNLQGFFLNNLAPKYGNKAISAASKIQGRTKSLMGEGESE